MGNSEKKKGKEKEKIPVIIDLEFTGLDNQFIYDNEIIQVKIMNIKNRRKVCSNFNSHKPLSAYNKLTHRVDRYKNEPYFSKSEFEKILGSINVSIDDALFYGFGTSMDIKMLKKYNIYISIIDIREYFQKTEYAYRMATKGSGLEEVYLIVTEKYPDKKIRHSDVSELLIIKKLYDKMLETPSSEYVLIVPHGFAAGMKIKDYVEKYRRQAEGYMYNNTDEFSRAIDHFLYETYYKFDYDYDDGDDYQSNENDSCSDCLDKIS
jgi:hypothetical protein